MAVDAAGNVIVTGWTRSTDFPLLHAMQSTLNNGASPARFDAFVAKLDSGGTKLLYSTFLGGPDDDGACGLALDSSGNAFVTGFVQAAAGFTGFKGSPSGNGLFVGKLDPQGALIYSYFHPNVTFAGFSTAGIAVDGAGSAYVAGTVTAPYAGSAIQVSGLLLGGSVGANGMAIAVDRTGAAYVAGTTNSVDFPLVRPLQSKLGARPLWKSTDGGVTWGPSAELPFAFLAALVADPTALNVLYAATTDGGIFKSLDGGASWNKASNGIADVQVPALAIDPLHPQTLFAADASGIVYKTVDGGANWIQVDSTGRDGTSRLAIDAQNPRNVYWNGGGVTRKSSDGGATWSTLPIPGTSIQSLVLDPRVSGTIIAISAGNPGKGSTFIPSYICRSTDGGANWVQLAHAVPGFSSVLTIDGSTNPSTVYVDLRARSTDGGATFTPLPASFLSDNATAIGVDPAGTLYASVYNTGMFVSRDRGQTWSPIGSPLPPPASYFGAVPNIRGIVPAGASGTIYDLVDNIQTSGFVSKLSPDGSSIVFSTLLNGHPSFASWVTYAAEPAVFTTQNWISAIALDPKGNVVVAGGTRSGDFPVVSAVQGYSAGRADAFTATMAPDGSRMISSTYLGGSVDEGALAVTTDAQGNVVLAGQAWSLDFPVPGGVQAPAGLGEAFVVKLAPVSPARDRVGGQRGQLSTGHRSGFVGDYPRVRRGEHQSRPHVARR